MVICDHDVPNRRACGKCQHTRRVARVQRAMDVLGRSCARCGIVHPLQWDHINDDGKAARTRVNGGFIRIYQAERAEITRILETGRSDRLQLLCANCNALKSYDRPAYDAAPAYGPLV